LQLDAAQSSAVAFVMKVERYYATLISGEDPASGLGGRLLYVGALDGDAHALTVAANIAGAASLAVCADAETAKQAMREGIVDFLVTSLDEALRILKNEIRKRETVAVCVALAPEIVEREMRERGVQPDLARPVEVVVLGENQSLLLWSVASAPALWLPKLDAIALDCVENHRSASGLDSETVDSASRWLRRAPRYLGRKAQGLRLLHCRNEIASEIVEQFRKHMESGEISVAVEGMLRREGQSEFFRLPKDRTST
jgi:urocanate hydratase